jgi:2-oxoisovalerate dehydrogenase E1 component
LLVSFANGVRMSRRVAKRLAAEGVAASVLDLRWLAPLPVDDLLAAARVLVVDETRAAAGRRASWPRSSTRGSRGRCNG